MDVMQARIDKHIRATVEEFNKSRYVRTMYSCAGHKRQKDQGIQVYIQFKIKKKYLPEFLALAIKHINSSMNSLEVRLKLSRVCTDGWPKPQKERISLLFDGLTHDIQVTAARGYFKRLSADTLKLL